MIPNLFIPREIVQQPMFASPDEPPSPYETIEIWAQRILDLTGDYSAEAKNSLSTLLYQPLSLSPLPQDLKNTVLEAQTNLRSKKKQKEIAVIINVFIKNLEQTRTPTSPEPLKHETPPQLSQRKHSNPRERFSPIIPTNLMDEIEESNLSWEN